MKKILSILAAVALVSGAAFAGNVTVLPVKADASYESFVPTVEMISKSAFSAAAQNSSADFGDAQVQITLMPLGSQVMLNAEVIVGGETKASSQQKAASMETIDEAISAAASALFPAAQDSSDGSLNDAGYAAQPAPAACPQAAESAPADSTKKKDRIFYKVMEFTYGNFGEHSYYQKGYGRIRNLDDETGYEGGLTYYLRWYFYDGGAFSIGMGTFYHYKKFTLEDTLALTDKVDIYYHNIGLDIPISFRLGVPYIPIFKPFISQTFNFHKPIFEIYKVEAPESEKELSKEEEITEAAKDQLGLGFLDDIETRFNGVKDLTFSVWLGIGLQITRHFSAEYQFNFGVGGSGHSHRFDTDNYWRVVVDFAW